MNGDAICQLIGQSLLVVLLKVSICDLEHDPLRSRLGVQYKVALPMYPCMNHSCDPENLVNRVKPEVKLAHHNLNFIVQASGRYFKTP